MAASQALGGSGKFAMRLNVWFLISLIMAVASVVGVFIFLPLISANAFWIAVAAYMTLASSTQMVVLNQMVSAIWIVRGPILGGDLPSVLWPSAVLGVLVLMFALFE